MASIEQRGPGQWRVGIRTSVEDGRRWIRRSLSFPADMPMPEQRARAELAAAQLQLEYEQGEVARQPEPITVRDFAEIWITKHVIPNCSPNTLKNYRFFLDSRILPALGDIKLSKLTPIRITDFLNSVRNDTARSTAIPADQRKRRADRERGEPPQRHLSDRTVRHYYDCLQYMLNKAVQWQYLEHNPMDRVDRPKVRKRKLKVLDDEQAVELLRLLAREESMPFRCSVLLALLCGLRLGEVGALTLDDINWADCSIDISKALKYTPQTGSYIGDPKSEAGVRVIYLPAGMMALLEETRKYHEDAAAFLGDRWHGCGRIVCTWDGKPVHHDTPSKWFRKFADRNGFEGVRFHDLRHTHATLLFANSIDAVAVASRLGHEDASTTLRIYAHAIRSRDLASAAVMQQLLDAAEAPDPSDADPSDPGQP